MGGHANRVIVNSIPKSGTYLVGLILRLVGVREVGLHLRDRRVWDWNKATDLDHVIRDPDAYMTKLSEGEALPYFGSGFVYAHFNTTETTRAYISSLKPCCHILCVRDLRDCLVSSFRFCGTARCNQRAARRSRRAGQRAARNILASHQDKGTAVP